MRCVTEFTGVEGYDYMQDFAGLTSSELETVKSSMEEGKQYTIKDNRDNKFYYISKLADGNIWMTQNLDYDIVNGGADINSDNTDVPSDWADGGNLVDTSTSSTWENRVFVPRSYDPGDNCWNGTVSTATTTTYSEMVTTCTDYHYHLGNYYNWTAATAMADSSNYATDDLNAEQSICPAGWTLPRSGSNTGPGSFDYLVNQANLTEGPSGNLHTSPYYFVYGGQRGVRDWLMVGINASYWSSTTFDVDGSYSLAFNSSHVLNPKGVGSRDYGDFVRCIVKN